MNNPYFIGFDMTEDEFQEADERTTMTRIRYWAHSLDKQLQLSESLKITFNLQRLERLKNLIRLYEMYFDTTRSDFVWAKRICELYSEAIEKQDDFKYPWQEKQMPVQASSLESILTERRSIRKFSKDDVPNEMIEKLISYASWAPSTCNLQNLRYIVIRSDEMKQGISHNLTGDMGCCIIAVIADLRFYSDPNIDGPYHDSGAAIQNILIGCHHLDLGACYVSDLGVNSDKLRRRLKLPEFEKITALIWIGLYKKAPLTPARKTHNELIEYV